MKVLIVFGTRPEAIKMAPLALSMAEDPAFETRICVTAQHREMLDQVLRLFAIVPDYDLDIMRPSQGLADITSRILTKMQSLLGDFRQDVVLVHGDTTTALATSLAAFYQHIPVGHVEAGLRASLEQRYAFLDGVKKMILVTGHRRENFGAVLREFVVH